MIVRRSICQCSNVDMDSGAGVGGLTFAIALAKHLSVSVDLYEAASEFSPTGAGIGIWPRVWDVLCRLGLGELATKASSPPTEDPGRTPLTPSRAHILTGSHLVNSFTFRKSDQAEGFKVHDMITKGTHFAITRPCAIRVTCSC